MTAAPVECRILTALLLAPMAAREVASVLSIDQPRACHRLAWLRESGDVRVFGNTDGKRPAKRYALTHKGRQWATELVA